MPSVALPAQEVPQAFRLGWTYRALDRAPHALQDHIENPEDYIDALFVRRVLGKSLRDIFNDTLDPKDALHVRDFLGARLRKWVALVLLIEVLGRNRLRDYGSIRTLAR